MQSISVNLRKVREQSFVNIYHQISLLQLPTPTSSPTGSPKMLYSRPRVFLAHALFIALLSSSLGVQATRADWTDTVFPEKTHDFGIVAVAAKTEKEFKVYNPYGQAMHIREVRASCGCTTPIVLDHYIQPQSTGTIIARFNTSTFTGKRGATLTVIIDQPFYAEARLQVNGYIRSDMVFHPGQLTFDRVQQGESQTRTTKVLYAGKNEWQIVDVVSNKPWVMAKATQLSRGNGRVDYEISAVVREDAPVGDFRDELIVMTNDRGMPRVPLSIQGKVESALSISPQSIALGTVKPGQSIIKRIVIRSQEPVLIQSIECEGWSVAFNQPVVANTTHLIEATFSPSEATGPQRKPIVITTSGARSVQAKALLTADVQTQSTNFSSSSF